MLNKLVLTKFKRHESLTVDFTGGLVAIRGANEAGKSTLYHAIAYALYGSRGLPASLEETVTYGYPVSQLRVELTFTHGGLEYTIVRSKSGASITGGGSSSQGQAEVTNFVTSLFGLKHDVASKITIANQSSLKSAVEGGVQAVQLIEALSGMDLIDELIGKVQEKLPCGNTAGIEAQIQGLQGLVAPVQDFSALEAAVNEASHALGIASASVNSLTADLELLPIKEARATLLVESEQRGQLELHRQQKSAAEALLATPEPALVLDRQAEFAAEIEADKLRSARRKLYLNFVAIKQQTESFGTHAEFSQNLHVAKTEAKKLQNILNSIQVQAATVGASRINDTSCALCGKLLTDVPEVVDTNKRVDGRLSELKRSELHHLELLRQAEEKITKLESVQQLDQSLHKAFAVFGDAIKTFDTVPLQARWVGDVPEATTESVDWKALADKNKAELANYTAIMTRRNQAKAVVEDSNKNIKQLEHLDTTSYQSPAQSVVDKWEAVDKQLKAAVAIYNAHKEVWQKADSNLSAAKRVYAAEVAAYKRGQEQLAAAKTLLQEYRDNNDLIQRLRNARPAVAKQLWNVVLSAVSHYFSQIRGVKSVVSKSDKGFTVDGKPYTDLSGSTIDSLGLAVRMALQKTFLPNLDFILLDEPASGCDSNRESAMLGVLSASGYSQVVLVTHSTLADTFAAQVVTL